MCLRTRNHIGMAKLQSPVMQSVGAEPAWLTTCAPLGDLLNFLGSRFLMCKMKTIITCLIRQNINLGDIYKVIRTVSGTQC